MAKRQPPAPDPSTACRILARVSGVYVCGVAHSAQWVEYPDGFFTAEQVATLREHLDLIVAPLSGPIEEAR